MPEGGFYMWRLDKHYPDKRVDAQWLPWSRGAVGMVWRYVFHDGKASKCMSKQEGKMGRWIR